MTLHKNKLALIKDGSANIASLVGPELGTGQRQLFVFTLLQPWQTILLLILALLLLHSSLFCLFFYFFPFQTPRCLLVPRIGATLLYGTLEPGKVVAIRLNYMRFHIYVHITSIQSFENFYGEELLMVTPALRLTINNFSFSLNFIQP